MARIIVLQHVAYEILGTMNPLFKQQGIGIRYINFSRDPDARPSLDGYDGLVILGGPMSVNESDLYPHLEFEIELIKEAMQRQMPVLGICLGAQLIAKANGAFISKNPCKEIGWYDVKATEEGKQDSFFRHFQGTEKIFQWHGDTFDIPNNATKLAKNETCFNQAFKINDNVYGLQFHLEVDEALIERWLTTPIHIEELKNLKQPIDSDLIRRETPKLISRSKQLSQQVFSEFTNLIGHKPKTKTPPLR